MKAALNIFSSILILAVFLVSCNANKSKTAGPDLKYTCPMHPQVIQDAPGTCPICKMDLVPMHQAGTDRELMLNASQIQLANIQTSKVGSGQFGSSKVLNARLVSNSENNEVISAKFPGRIDKLFEKEPGRKIPAGAALYSIYSEELQTLQQDYLLQVKQAAAFPDEKIYQNMKEAAKNKLLLFGFTNDRIAALGRSKRISPNITVFAKRSGVLKTVNVSEGSYITEGTIVMELESFGNLWVEADVFPADLKLVKEGMEVQAQVNGASGNLRSFRVNYISPQINPGTQLITIRGTIPNPSGQLQAGMQARVLLPAASVSNAVRLPLAAVIRSAEGAHIWIRTGKETFAPRNVTTGAEDADNIVITSGLRDGEEVVISGAYLLYSEFILKKGADPMLAHDHQ